MPWTSATIALKGAWAAAIGALVLALAVFGGLQTARLEGFHVWPVSMTGWIRTAELRAAERDAEAGAHRKTKTEYAAAQTRADELEKQRLERVRAQQKDASDAIVADYRSRIAAVRDRAEQLRGKGSPSGSGVAGTGGAGAVPGLSPAPGGAAEAAGDQGFPRSFDEQLARDLIASEQAEQLDALIDFVTAQAAIDPNSD